MIKLVVCDMDGTLLDKNLKVSKENLKAIEKLRNKGIEFTVATGRPEQLMKEYIDELNLQKPFIMYNGSVIGHPDHKDNVYELYHDADDVKQVVAVCEELGSIYMMYTKEQIFSNPNYRREYFEKRNETLTERQKAIFKSVDDIDEILKNNKVYKVLIVENDLEKNQKLLDAVKDNPKFKIAVSQKGFIDVNPKGASKGNALEVLLRAYGVTKDEVVVFGDQDNDISMLELVTNSVSMENASPGAKAASKYQTGSNEKSGVADWLNMNVIK